MPNADADSPILLWFRRDLRLADNPALAHAVASGRPVLPLFILDDEAAPGAAARWWLHHSLTALADDLQRIGLPLLLRRGRAADVLDAVVAETGAGVVMWNRLYHPAAVARDKVIKQDLRARGIMVQSHDGALLFEPWTIRNKAGAPFKVFTPFWRACLAAPEPAPPTPAPRRAHAATAPQGDRLAGWALPPTRPDWAAGFAAHWRPGEAGALARLHDFIANGLRHYAGERDRPDLPATSRLSPHLAFGEIGPRQVWHAVHHSAGRDPALSNGAIR
ncbi:MAG: deoxyribodipyrimidine photo-lyase, partial [Zavarzinia sp.]|nr:deoxyribodipyrimidine photo-lyase [Zavarzinia sp.]